MDLRTERLRTESGKQRKRWLFGWGERLLSIRALLSYLFFGLLLSTTHSSRAQQDSILTYSQAVSIALKENLLIQQQNNLLSVAKAEQAQAYAQFAPSVAFEANSAKIFGRQFDNTAADFTDEASRLSGGISASLPLFNGLNNYYQLRQSQASAGAQVQLIGQTKQNVIFNVSRQYLQVLLNQELLSIAKTNLKQQEVLLESIVTFVKSGIRNLADQYNQEAETKRIALSVVEAENALATSKVRLIRTLQLDPFQTWHLAKPEVAPEEILTQTIDLQQAYQLAIAHRADWQSQQNTIQANRHGVGVARSRYWPSLSLDYYFGSQYSTLFAPTLREQLLNINNVQVFSTTLSIPIFNNRRTHTEVQRQKQQLRNAELDLEDLERTILEQLQTALADYRAARQRLAASRAQVKAAQQALESEQARFHLGVGNVLDINRVNAAYVEAQASLVQANYTLMFQKTALDYYTGQLQTETINN